MTWPRNDVTDGGDLERGGCCVDMGLLKERSSRRKWWGGAVLIAEDLSELPT